jgi:hypothetical protein
MKTGNPMEHLKALQNKKKLEARGEPSLMNVLEMARSGLSSVCSFPPFIYFVHLRRSKHLDRSIERTIILTRNDNDNA